ncbi:YbaK/EbsC family protein [Candidatus Vondammii sp. HM_W22]|uniref:YbaK/EbsC family protein n=1 Tax=Candidatus Vondammii sp. HM_W22 TaxID=2687299 RepID=UPI00403E32D9
MLQRKLRLVPEDEPASVFTDCEIGSVPPMGEAYGIETLADSSLLDQPELLFKSQVITAYWSKWAIESSGI